MSNIVLLILIFVGITGVLNGIFLFFYLHFGYSKKNPANTFLAYLILFLTVRMAKSLVTSLIPVSFIVINAGLAAFVSVGPMLLLYFQKSINPTLKIAGIRYLHFLPALLVLLCTLLPYPQNDPIWDLRYNLIMIQLLLYLIVTFLFFIRKIDHYNPLPYKKGWYKFIIGSVSLIWLSYGLTWWVGILPYLSGTFVFCLFVYILIYLWLNKKQINESFEKYRNSILSKSDSQALFVRINSVMKNTRPYLDHDITLTKLATLLQTKPHLLSQAINENFNTNFFDFINVHRIDEVKERLVSPDFANLTIAAIAYDCGFNSISSFNTAFKKKEKMSPKNYREIYFRS